MTQVRKIRQGSFWSEREIKLTEHITLTCVKCGKQGPFTDLVDDAYWGCKPILECPLLEIGHIDSVMKAIERSETETPTEALGAS